MTVDGKKKVTTLKPISTAVAEWKAQNGGGSTGGNNTGGSTGGNTGGDNTGGDNGGGGDDGLDNN